MTLVTRDHWHLITRKSREKSASVRCPDCKQWYPLDHEIDADGFITPSVDCPTEGCEFHDFVRLLGWEP